MIVRRQLPDLFVCLLSHACIILRHSSSYNIIEDEEFAVM